MSTRKVGSIEVLHQPTKRPDHGEPRSPSRVILKPGHQRTGKKRPIQVETIMERDQILTMRDGVALRADIYRPVTDEKVPAIIMYGPYGKSGSGMYSTSLQSRVYRQPAYSMRSGWFNLDKFPLHVGVAESKLSGYENFEGSVHPPFFFFVFGHATNSTLL